MSTTSSRPNNKNPATGAGFLEQLKEDPSGSAAQLLLTASESQQPKTDGHHGVDFRFRYGGWTEYRKILGIRG